MRAGRKLVSFLRNVLLGTVAISAAVLVPVSGGYAADAATAPENPYTLAAASDRTGEVRAVKGASENESFPSQIIVVVDPDQTTKVYGSKDPEFTYMCRQSSDQDEISCPPEFGKLERRQGENAGVSYEWILEAEDYEVKFHPEYFEITPKPITVAVVPNQSKLYGEDDPYEFDFTISCDSKISYNSSTIRCDHEVGVENTVETWSGYFWRESGEDIGAYPIYVESYYEPDNYRTTLVGADFKILPWPVTVTVVAGQGKLYGEDDPDTLEYTYTYTPNTFEDMKLYGKLDREPGEHVGQYAITLGTLTVDSTSHYAIDFVGGIFDILPKTPCADVDPSTPFIPVTDVVADLPDSVKYGTPVWLYGAVVPYDATNQRLVWSVEASRSTGAFIRNDTLYTTNVGTGPVIVRATVVNGRAVCEDFVKDFDIDIYRDPKEPRLTSGYNSGYLSAGPNPVRTSGTVKGMTFYYTGGRIDTGTLYISDAMGNVMAEIKILTEEPDINEEDKRKIAFWDLTNKDGRLVATGTYLIKGTIKYGGGGIGEVRMLIGVAR